jgi:(p)ppGpp synthase/HD superfamily hydrolase
MHKEQLKNVKLEQQLNSTTNADVTTSSHTNGNTMLAAAFSSELVSKAREYATLKHFETNHKYDGQPYDVHLKMVYEFACKYVHLLPDNKTISDVLASCWVHDVIEDCRQTYNDVKNVLGERVAEIAYALTNEKGKTRKERANDKYYEGIRSTPFAAYVKICDRLANVTYSKLSKSKMIEAYKKENEDFKKQLWSLAYQEMFDDLSACF